MLSCRGLRLALNAKRIYRGYVECFDMTKFLLDA